MQYLALATDYDGTLAHDGHVDESTVAACRRLRESGRKLILVTGRELTELKHVFADYALCDVIVAENGALLYWPESDREQLLGEPPPPEFAALVQARGVAPCSFGRCVVGAWRPHEQQLLPIIQELGLALQLIFNKDAVMVLPSGINKATGLAVVLTELGLTGEQVVGIGDAENDLAFLDICAVGVAVANALPSVMDRCDLVTPGDHGRGVRECIEGLLADDLQSLGPRRPRQEVVVTPTAHL
jgi:hydroxymethylpyrimidine pyrophosphatase-like HAD family hydrolase